MNAKLVFCDWQRNGKSIYNTEDGIALTTGDLHSGSMFPCEIEFTERDTQIPEELREAARAGARAVFLVIPQEETT